MKTTLIISALIYIGFCTTIKAESNGETTANVDAKTTQIGGSDAYIEDYPYQVSVRINDEHVCGGAIVDEQWVLTAAHCVSDSMDTSLYNIRVGSSYVNGGNLYSVSNIVLHFNYEPNGTECRPFDLALLKITTAITFDETTQPVALADNLEDFSCEKCVITGWAETSWWSHTTPNILQASAMYVQSHGQCASSIFFHCPISEKQHVCVQEFSSKAPCSDSGGPLVCQQGGLNLLVGVMSRGSRFVLSTSVYIRTDTFREWIIDTIATFPC